MNTEYFIAKRILKGDKKVKISRPIIRISILSIILGIIVMILSVSVVTGFQNKVREKVISFGSHIQISALNQDHIFENAPLLMNEEYITDILEIEGIKSIQPIGYRAGILQSGKDSIHFEIDKNGAKIDTTIVRQEIKSILAKGVNHVYDWDIFSPHIIEGNPPIIKKDSISNEILVSKRIASQLHLSIRSDVRAYFIDQSGPKIRIFTVSGIYNTGLEEFDEELVFIDLQHIQKLNNWGIEAYANFSDTCYDNQYIIAINATGGNKNYLYDWLDGDGFGVYSKRAFCPYRDTAFQIAVSDFESLGINTYDGYGIDDAENPLSIPDTTKIEIKVTGQPYSCQCQKNPIKIDYQEDGMGKTLFFDWGKVEISLSNTGGTQDLYCGGFEIVINDWDKLQLLKNRVYDELPADLKAQSIADIYPEIFNWLDFLDTNVIIIITLMIIIAIINMSSALLVLILEKTNMIGMLKALGADSWSVRKIFLYLSSFLILRGLFWGNLLGIGLALIQIYFEPLQLDPEIYYVNAAPVELNWMHILYINIGTLIVCVIMLVIPSVIINKISPIKAIRFD